MQQPIKRKKIIKWLNKIAKLMPEKTYQVAHKLAFPVYTDPEGNMYTEQMEAEGIKRRAVWRYVEEHPVNHKRRMLKMWDKFHDIRAIDSYMRIVGNIGLMQDAPVDSLEPQILDENAQQDNSLPEEKI